MDILFLSHYFLPEVNAPASRGYEHCKYWVEQGHRVTVITCIPNHPHGKIYSGYKRCWWFEESINGIRVIRLPTYISANKGFGKRIFNHISYALAVIFFSPRFPKTDVVLSTSPQFFNGLVGYFISRVKRCPWVLEIRDLWPDSILSVGVMNNSKVISILRYLERFAYKKCDLLIPVTDSFKQEIHAKHDIPLDKMRVIKNGVNLQYFYKRPPVESVKQSLGLQQQKVVAYIGTHGMAHQLDILLEAAELIKNEKHITILLVGDGAERDRLLSIKDKNRLHNVIMLEQQNKAKIVEILSIVDVGLVLLKKDKVFTTVLPSKMFELMASHIPIISNVEGEAKALLNKSKSGLQAKPENAQSLASKIKALCYSVECRKDLGDNGRIYVEKYFCRQALAQNYLNTLFETVKLSRYSSI